MKKKLSYDEILDFVDNCGVQIARTYTYKGNDYQVNDITLVAGLDTVQFNVSYYPVDNLVVRFSREIEDFKSKFKLKY